MSRRSEWPNGPGWKPAEIFNRRRKFGCRTEYEISPGKWVSRQRAWQVRNQREGKCHQCMEKRDPNSATFCTKHHLEAREAVRIRQRVKNPTKTADQIGPKNSNPA